MAWKTFLSNVFTTICFTTEIDGTLNFWVHGNMLRIKHNLDHHSCLAVSWEAAGCHGAGTHRSPLGVCRALEAKATLRGVPVGSQVPTQTSNPVWPTWL